MVLVYLTVEIPLSLKTLVLIKWKNREGSLCRYRLIDRVSMKWRDFGVKLDITKNNLDVLDYQYRGNVAIMWSRVMQDTWMNGWDEEKMRDYPLSWNGLYRLLEDVECESSVIATLKRAVRRAIQPLRPVIQIQVDQEECNIEEDGDQDLQEAAEEVVARQSESSVEHNDDADFQSHTDSSVSVAQDDELAASKSESSIRREVDHEESVLLSYELVMSVEPDNQASRDSHKNSRDSVTIELPARSPDHSIVLPIVLLNANLCLHFNKLAFVLRCRPFHATFQLCWFSKLTRPFLQTLVQTPDPEEELD